MNYFQLLYDLCSIYDSLENKVVTHKDIIRKIKKTVPFTECKIIGNSSLSLATNSFIVAGLYDCELDEEGKPPIEVEIIFPKRKETFLFTQDDVSKEHWGEFCIDFANILGHEFVHLNQFRRRNFNWSRPYKSINTKPGIKEQQEYYGDPDEIDAYAFNIACALSDKFNKDHEKIVQYLNADLKDKRFKKNGYTMYLETFDHDHRHRVIKKLKKKIMYYLPYTTLGKPYKTSDWLK